MTAEVKSGLAGVIAGKSAIATVGQIGVGLLYRGYNITDLAAYASFEEVAYLLVHGELPNKSELERYRHELIQHRHLPKALLTTLELIPADAHPMDVLRTGVSMLGNLEPEHDQQQQRILADKLIAKLPAMLCYWYHFQQQGQRVKLELDDPSLAGYFLHLLHGKRPSTIAEQTVNASLILYAEHEFNASTFAARVTAATGSDIYSAITSAIGTLKGPLHGGANEEALKLIQKFKSADEAEQGIMQMLANKEKIMGFGHRVYTTGDPRSPIIKKLAHQVCQEAGQMELYNIADRIEHVMSREKKLFANLDFFSSVAYHYCGIPTSMFTPVFVLARITGWVAHVFEQRADNKLIRPLSEYIGPEPQNYISIDKR